MYRPKRDKKPKSNDEGRQCKLLPCNLAIFLKYQSLNPNSSTDDDGSRWMTTTDLVG